MAVLQIVSDRAQAGKTSLAGALLLQLAETGRSAAYFKPFSKAGPNDADVSFLSHDLLNHNSAPRGFNGQLFPSSGTDLPPLSEDIQRAVAQLEDQADLVLVESPDLISTDGTGSSIAVDLSSLLDSTVLALFRYTPDLNSASMAAAVQPLGERLAGVIINGVTAYRTQQVKENLAGELSNSGISVLGALPEDRIMLGVTVEQLADYLGGRWVQEPENTDASVERFLIGGNIMDRGPTYFGRYANQAVVTRAARPDIQMACLTSDVRCLVLTGGDEPTEYVKAEAMQRGVPLILVEAGTLETVDGLGGLLNLATSHSRHKIDRFLALLRDNLDLDSLVGLVSSP